jgi:hypothetical protein
MARLTAPNGAVVSVDDGKVAALTARGYTTGKAPASSKADDTEPVPSSPGKSAGKSGKK